MKSSPYIKEIMNNVYSKQVHLTKFLTLNEQQELVYLCGNNFNVKLDGGYDDAKLKRALISSFEIEDNNLQVVLVKISTSNKFYTLRHPTVKWHFLNLGIDEKMFGDIVLVDEDFYVAMAKEVYEIVMADSQTINKCPISYEIVDNVIVEDTKEVYKAFCSGLRVDNIIAKTFHLSRDKAQKYLVNERVSINSTIIKKLTYTVSEGDVINIRSVGKVIIKDISVNNKSGKYIVNHNRYIHKK